MLAFVLDNLLSPCQTAGDRDCPALSRVLIASIASCNHCPEAQVQLAAEVKAALQRALNLPESSEKHVRLQALTGIISTMIESCPTPGQVPNQVFKGQQNLMNVMVKILIRRGLVTDLARVPHSLDLSSPYMASTINATLKPLETLSRIVNQPQALSAKSRSKNQGVGRDTSTFVETLANNVEGKLIISVSEFPVLLTMSSVVLLLDIFIFQQFVIQPLPSKINGVKIIRAQRFYCKKIKISFFC